MRIKILLISLVFSLITIGAHANVDAGSCDTSSCKYKYSTYPTRSCSGSEQWKDDFDHIWYEPGRIYVSMAEPPNGGPHCHRSGAHWRAQCGYRKTLT